MTSPWIVMTDLDGTLLDHQTYSFEAAMPALKALQQAHIPCLLNTSKTFAETVQLRADIGLDVGFSCENGAALFIPKASGSGFAASDYNAEILGCHYPKLLKVLHALRQQGFLFRGFNDMTALEVSALTGLDSESASLAKQRHGSEPIVWQDTEDKLPAFCQALAQQQLRLVRGGRFWHVLGANDKADALHFFTNYYQQLWQQPVKVLALGDGDNDASMLTAADLAVVIPNPGQTLLLTDGHVRYAITPGPRGWNLAVLEWLQKIDPSLNQGEQRG